MSDQLRQVKVILRSLLEFDYVDFDDRCKSTRWYCKMCGGAVEIKRYQMPSEKQIDELHKPGCPVVEARKFLEESDG